MIIKALRKQEQVLQLRSKVLQAEHERLNGKTAISVTVALSKEKQSLMIFQYLCYNGYEESQCKDCAAMHSS